MSDMTSADFEVVRDPLWNNIRVDAEALGVLDSEPFQRLRYVRQLGHAFLVYPGATHTRFEHALGAYHLTRRTLALLDERAALDATPTEERRLVALAALLHDVGHYPFSHALEEAGLPSHEDLAAERLAHPELAAALRVTGMTRPAARITALIRGTSESPLQGLISGSLDLDKIEYLTRDARMCGVPYGTVDVDRLIHSITLVSWKGQPTIGVHEKGVSALESLLFAKYQMYRNVYWHHAVRSATAMFKRVVRDAIASGELSEAWIARTTDEALMERLKTLEARSGLAQRLRRRALYKRALDLRASAVPAGAGSWIAAEPALVARVEDGLARELGLAPGELLLDFPVKPEMLSVDLPLVTRDGTAEHLTTAHDTGRLGIQRVAEELHTSARRLRVFTATPITIEERSLLALIERSAKDLEEDLGAERALLG